MEKVNHTSPLGTAKYRIQREASIVIQFTLKGVDATQESWPTGQQQEATRKWKHTWIQTRMADWESA